MGVGRHARDGAVGASRLVVLTSYAVAIHLLVAVQQAAGAGCCKGLPNLLSGGAWLRWRRRRRRRWHLPSHSASVAAPRPPPCSHCPWLVPLRLQAGRYRLPMSFHLATRRLGHGRHSAVYPPHCESLPAVWRPVSSCCHSSLQLCCLGSRCPVTFLELLTLPPPAA